MDFSSDLPSQSPAAPSARRDADSGGGSANADSSAEEIQARQESRPIETTQLPRQTDRPSVKLLAENSAEAAPDSRQSPGEPEVAATKPTEHTASQSDTIQANRATAPATARSVSQSPEQPEQGEPPSPKKDERSLESNGNAAAKSISSSTEPVLVVNGMTAEPTNVSMPSGNATIVSRRCLTKETANEDAAVAIPLGDRGVVLAVADGVGGLPQGEEAAQITLKTLVEYVSKAKDPDRIRIAIIDAIEKANRRVLALGGGAGTTLAVAQIIDHRVRTYHVGDSEIFVVGGRGAIKLQTLAHGPVAYGVHCGLIDPVDALVHEYRNVISNVVGAHDMRIELGPQLKLAQRDLVFVCSDGITDNLYAEELVRIICGKAPDAAASVLMQELELRREQKGELEFKDDDSTFVLYRRNKTAKEK